MVVAQEPLAAQVGLQVLKDGGNAIDAAIAVGFALAVTHPVAGNLGGGGFLLVRLHDGRAGFLDFREVAPAGASRSMYLDKSGKPTRDSIFGWRSAGVPGTVAGWGEAHRKYGTLPWTHLVVPAVRLARDGFPVTSQLMESFKEGDGLPTDAESRRIFSHLRKGQIFRQPELARTLERIQDHGAAEFYSGETARQLVAQMAAHGGLITTDDLKQYQPVERTPLRGRYKQFEIITAPPPSAGGIGLLQMLGMLDRVRYDTDGPNSPKAVHYEAEAMRRFYADRSEYLGDPAFFNVPVKELLDPKYLGWRVRTIAPERATPSDAVQPGLPHALNARAAAWHESNDTTHFNVVDGQGNAAAVTYTLNNSYGSGITVPGLGFLLNDEMDDFSAAPGAPNMFGLVGSDANAIEPGKRPLSSMNPTIVTRDGQLFLVIGAPGGSRITTGVLQVMLDLFDFHLTPQEAIDLPRFHEQWKPDYLYVESGFPKPSEQALARAGYTVRPIDGVARVEVIEVSGGRLAGGLDGREGGGIAQY